MRVFVKRDLDGFFGLFVDNLVQLLMIIQLCTLLCGMSAERLFRIVLPGAAVSILLGNLFYAWQAHQLAKKTGRDDVTALPYGINTPSLLVFVFFVIMPEYQRTGSEEAAWRLGLIACLGSGLVELCGAFIAGWVRKHTPRAALLSTLAGIAIGFISMTFALQIFSKPLIAMLPLAIVLLGLFSRVRLPLGLPSGLVAVGVGTAFAWLMVLTGKIAQLPEWASYGQASVAAVRASLEQIAWSPPVWSGEAIREGLSAVHHWVPFLSVVIPMGLFNVIGSMQNIESAEAGGDAFPTGPSMAANGLGTIVAALFGSCFPTTIYIGHPGWKALGARAGYSTLNGLVIVALALSGLVGLIAAIVPIEAGAAIILWIGIIITAQAFQVTPREHAPAVAVGLFPAIAAWGATVMMGTFLVAEGTSLQSLLAGSPAPVAESAEDSTAPEPHSETANTEEVAPDNQPQPDQTTPQTLAHHSLGNGPRSSREVNGFLVHGLLLMERGYILTCMILAAASACLIDRKFTAAGIWMAFAGGCTILGLMHSYQVFAGNALDSVFLFVSPIPGAYIYRAWDIGIGYLFCSVFFLLIGRWAQHQPELPDH